MTIASIRKNLWLFILALAWPVSLSAQTINIPAAPAYLYASLSSSGGQVALNWAGVPTAARYNVYRAGSPTTDYSYFVCSTSGADSTNCYDTAVTAGQTYTYRVEACAEGNICSGTGGRLWTYSSAVTVGPINTCGGFTLTTSQSSYTIGQEVNYTWSCSSGLAPYVQIQLVKPDNSVVTYDTYSGDGRNSKSGGFSTAGLNEGSYTLRACWTAGCAVSHASTIFTLTQSAGGGGTTTIPVPPSSLTATISSIGVYLVWPSVPGATYYKVWRSLNSVTPVWSEVCGSPIFGVSCTDLNVPTGTYQYGIESCLAGVGCSGTANRQWTYSSAVTISGGNREGGEAPPAPANLRRELSADAAIILKWDDNASGADTFKMERKLSSAAEWSGAFRVELPGSPITSYRDTSVTAGLAYDYRVQACLSGSGCSAYTYLLGITVGPPSPQTAQAVTVQILEGVIISSGMVTFSKDGVSLSAYLNNSSSATVYLLPGIYEIWPVLPGIDSDEIQLSGTEVKERKLVMGTTTAVVKLSLPVRLPVRVIVTDTSAQPLADARVDLGVLASSAYVVRETTNSGIAWFQLPAGVYRGLVSKVGYLPKNVNLTISKDNTEFTVTLEPLPISVSGKVLADDAPVAFAVVRAVSADNGAIVVATADETGAYRLALKSGRWRMSASADGYYEGDGITFTLAKAPLSQNLSLGGAVRLTASSASIMPNTSVTVRAPELGVAVDLPANALAGSGGAATVTVRQSTQAVATAAAVPLTGSVRDVSAQTETGAVITNLNAAATIVLDYTAADLMAAGLSPSQAAHLKLAVWDKSRSDWQVLASAVDTTNQKVRGTTLHFTLFAIVLPFLVQPAAAGEGETSAPSAIITLTDDRAAQFAALVAEGTKVYVSCSECLAAAVGRTRDINLENKYDAEMLGKIIGQDAVGGGARSLMVNFVTYGTASTIHLGAGERAGVLASFRTAYGHLPNSEYDWQEVLKIANGRWPGRLLPDRETAMKAIFKKIYLREAVVTNPNDSAALAIMAYGLRSARRNLRAEAAAIATFRAVFGYSPSSAADWDVVRAVAYSGAKQ